MDIFKAFILNGTEHNVNILWENNKPLFRASEIANILEINNIHASLVTFDEDEKIIRSVYNEIHGNRDITFLTEIGLYRLIMNSRKPIAKPFQKWVCKVIESIRETGKYELELKIKENENRIINLVKDQIKEALELEAIKTSETIEKNNTNALAAANKDKYITYIGKIKTINNKILIKIGSTKNMYTRTNDLNTLFGSFNIIKLFECPRNEAFERFLHKHPIISPFKYNEKFYESDDKLHFSIETFLVTQEELTEVINVAVHNKFKFNNAVDHAQIVELESIKLKQLETKKDNLELLDKLKIDPTDSDKEDDVYIDPVIMLQDFRKHTQARGNKIQKYSIDGKTLLKTYESFAYAMRDVDEVHVSRNCIKNAIDNNITYKNFRWAELDREMPDDTFQTLPETVEKKKNVKIGFVAMLNLDKNKIVEVFCDQKEAGIQRKMTSTASICKAIKRNSISSGHYFMMWADCSKDLQDEYLSHSKLPSKRVNGIEVLQLHPITDKIIENYVCIEDVIKKYKISRQTLKSACEFGIIAKGYKWQFK